HSPFTSLLPLCEHCGVPAVRPDQPAQDKNALGAEPRPAGRWRPSALDWIAAGLFVLGLVFVGTGLLPYSAADATIRRILPLLLFLGTVIVLAELTAAAGFFDVIAVRVAGVARGSYPALFVLCVLFATLTPRAFLLRPVILALARMVGIAATRLAMRTWWLPNTASLLLPVSNLTNLLAANRVALPPLEFAARMWGPQLASVAVTMVF